MFDKEFIEFKKVISDLQEPKKILTEDEEADEIVRRLATPPPSISDFQRIVIPMIRKIIPTMIANEIIGVQPMQGPVEKIRTLKAKFTDDSRSK